MTDLSILVDLARRGCRLILLQPQSKDPISRDGHHWITTDPGVIQRHRGNVGIMAGPHAVLDFDVLASFGEMCAELGTLTPTAETGSGKLHCYVEGIPNLPRRFFWQGQKVGEIARLASEYVVVPPSIHPVVHKPYRWLVDPHDPLPSLSAAWQLHLLAQPERPDFIPAGDTTGVDFSSDWDGPSAAELLRRAMTQPGATRRSHGVKFQCAGCAAEGHDRHRDNALVRLDGRWGCAVDPNHAAAIGEQLGAFAPKLLTGVRGVRGF